MTDISAPRGLVLRGTHLRYVLVRLLQLIGPATVAELADGLHRWGFAVEGRPSKTISDALRWERRRDRVRRLDRGRYRAGGMPRSTEHRIIWRVVALREQARRQAVSLEGGQQRHTLGGPGGDRTADSETARPRVSP
jgi:hypothetical protein